MLCDAGAAFWEFSYIAGPPDSNQVLFNESTWTNIILPSADNALQTMLSKPAVANCVPGDDLVPVLPICTISSALQTMLLRNAHRGAFNSDHLGLFSNHVMRVWPGWIVH